MLWQGRRESDNVEDDRGITGGHIAAGGGILGVIVLLVKLFLGGSVDTSQLQPGGQGQQLTPQEQALQDSQVHFVKVVLAETEDVWNQQFPAQTGRQYTDPKLVIFSGSAQSACGFASAATGPFYCPGDQRVYIDLSFYEELQNRFGASGNFAQAYVVAHEVGHHLQKLMGISDKMDQIRQQVSDEEYNKYSVRLELQADYFAGVWAHYEQGRGVLEKQDIPNALNAANAIGDDRLQKETQGYVVPESFTHGTSAERMYWFKKGYETGDIKQGDTFSATDLH